jgi:hypothetical protein
MSGSGNDPLLTLAAHVENIILITRNIRFPHAGSAGIDYEVDRLVFLNDKRNELKLSVTLFEKPEGDKRPNKTSFYMKPVRFEGKWYLTTKDNITDTNSRERNEPVGE